MSAPAIKYPILVTVLHSDLINNTFREVSYPSNACQNPRQKRDSELGGPLSAGTGPVNKTGGWRDSGPPATAPHQRNRHVHELCDPTSSFSTAEVCAGDL